MTNFNKIYNLSFPYLRIIIASYSTCLQLHCFLKLNKTWKPLPDVAFFKINGIEITKKSTQKYANVHNSLGSFIFKIAVHTKFEFQM